MPSRINATRTPPQRAVRYDAGPALINAVNQIGPGTDNATIDRLAGNIAGQLKSRGVSNTKWVGEMLYQLRGTAEGVPGDKTKFIANVNKAVQLGVLGPNGRSTLLSKVGAVAETQDNQARVENSILNVKNQKPREKRDLFETPAILKGTSYEYKPQNPLGAGGGKTTSRTQNVTQKKPEVPTPQLDSVIDGLKKTMAVMPAGAVKESLGTVKASLELARTAKKDGDAVAYAKAVGGLGESVFKTVGEVVKTFGQDGALAAQAADQLGKVAKLIGKGTKAVGMVDDLSKVVRGKTLGGAEVNAGQRTEAAANLVATALGVGVPFEIAKAKLAWCYEHIGVPAKQALTDYGLKRLFGGKSVEQMRAQVSSLPANDPAKAQWVLSKLFSGTFPNTSSGFSQATASSLWDRFKARELQGYNQEMKFLNEHAKTKPGENPIVDEMRVAMAQRYQSAALRFISEQVVDAKGSWPV